MEMAEIAGALDDEDFNLFLLSAMHLQVVGPYDHRIEIRSSA